MKHREETGWLFGWRQRVDFKSKKSKRFYQNQLSASTISKKLFLHTACFTGQMI
jgi:hypothetical protein